MPSISDIRNAWGDAAKGKSDYDLADAYAKHNGVSMGMALYDLGVPVKQHSDAGWEWEAAKSHYMSGLARIPAAMGSEAADDYANRMESQGNYERQQSSAPNSWDEMELGKNGLAYLRQGAIGSAPFMGEALGWGAAEALTGGGASAALVGRLGLRGGVEAASRGFAERAAAKAYTTTMEKAAAESAAVAAERGFAFSAAEQEAAKTVAHNAAVQHAMEAAEAVSKRATSATALTATTYPSSLGDVLGNQHEQNGSYDFLSAGALALPYAAMNTLGLEGMAGGVNALQRGGIRRGLMAAGETMLGEAGNETGQEVMNQMGRMAVDPNAQLFSDDAMARYKESAIMGGLLGGVGGSGHIVSSAVTPHVIDPTGQRATDLLQYHQGEEAKRVAALPQAAPAFTGFDDIDGAGAQKTVVPAVSAAPNGEFSPIDPNYHQEKIRRAVVAQQELQDSLHQTELQMGYAEKDGNQKLFYALAQNREQILEQLQGLRSQYGSAEKDAYYGTHASGLYRPGAVETGQRSLDFRDRAAPVVPDNSLDYAPVALDRPQLSLFDENQPAAAPVQGLQQDNGIPYRTTEPQPHTPDLFAEHNTADGRSAYSKGVGGDLNGSEKRGVLNDFLRAFGTGDWATASKVGAKAAAAADLLPYFNNSMAKLRAMHEQGGVVPDFAKNAELEKLYDIVGRGEQALAEKPVVEKAAPTGAARKAAITNAYGGKENISRMKQVLETADSVWNDAKEKIAALRRSKKGGVNAVRDDAELKLRLLRDQFDDAKKKHNLGKLIQLQEQMSLFNDSIPKAAIPSSERQHKVTSDVHELWRQGHITDEEAQAAFNQIRGGKNTGEAEVKVSKWLAKKEAAKADYAAKIDKAQDNAVEEELNKREPGADFQTVKDFLERITMLGRNNREGSAHKWLVDHLASLVNIARYGYEDRAGKIKWDIEAGMLDRAHTADHAKYAIELAKEKGLINDYDIWRAQSKSRIMDLGAGNDVDGFTEHSDRAVKSLIARIGKTDTDVSKEGNPWRILNKAALKLGFVADPSVNIDSTGEGAQTRRTGTEKLLKAIAADLNYSKLDKVSEEEREQILEHMAETYGADVVEVVVRHMDTSAITKIAQAEFSRPDRPFSALNPERNSLNHRVSDLMKALLKLGQNPDTNDRREALYNKLMDGYNYYIRDMAHNRPSLADFVSKLLAQKGADRMIQSTRGETGRRNVELMTLRRDLLDASKDKHLAEKAAAVRSTQEDSAVERAAKVKAAKEDKIGQDILDETYPDTEAALTPAPKRDKGATDVVRIGGEPHKVTYTTRVNANGKLVVDSVSVVSIEDGTKDEGFNRMVGKPLSELADRLRKYDTSKVVPKLISDMEEEARDFSSPSKNEDELTDEQKQARTIEVKKLPAELAKERAALEAETARREAEKPHGNSKAVQAAKEAQETAAARKAAAEKATAERAAQELEIADVEPQPIVSDETLPHDQEAVDAAKSYLDKGGKAPTTLRNLARALGIVVGKDSTPAKLVKQMNAAIEAQVVATDSKVQRHKKRPSMRIKGGGIQYSVAADSVENPTTVKNILATIREWLGADAMASDTAGAPWNKQKLQIFQTLDELPANLKVLFARPDVQGIAWDGERAVLVADRIESGSELAVLLHEVGEHVGLEGFIGNDGITKMVSHIDRMGKGGTTIERAAVEAARARIPADTNPSVMHRELIAYTAEELLARDIKPSMKGDGSKSMLGTSFLNRLTNAIRGAINRLFGIRAGQEFTGQDLLDVLQGAAATTLRSPAMESTPPLANKPIMLSVASATAPILQNIPAGLRVFVKPVAMQIKQLFGSILRPLMPMLDVIESMTSHGFSKATAFKAAWDRRDEIKQKMELVAEKIGKAFTEMNVDRQLAISKFLNASTRSTEGWAYQPTWLKDQKGNAIAVKIDPKLEAEWNAMPQAEKDIIDAVFKSGDDTWNLKNELINQAIKDKYTELVATQQMTPAEAKKAQAEEMAERGKKLARDLSRPYAPLKRFGKYAIVGMSPEFQAAWEKDDTAAMNKLRGDAKHYYVAFRDSMFSAAMHNAEREKLGDGLHYESMERTLLAEKQIYEVPMHAIEQMKEQIGRMELEGKDKNRLNKAVSNLYIELLAQENARKSELQRYGVAGEDDDMMQAFLSQSRADASLLSTLQSNREILLLMRDLKKEAGHNMPKTQLYNELVKRYVNSTKYDGSTWEQKMMRGNSVMMLITSPMYLFANATQPVVMTIPKLASYFGYKNANAALYKAYEDIAKKGLIHMRGDALDTSKLSPDEKAVIDKLQQLGKIDITVMQEIGQWAQSGTIPKTALGRMMKENSVSKAGLRGLSWVSSLPQRVEMMNRISTGLAAYRLEMEKSGDAAKATSFAAKMIDETQGDYTSANSPRLFQPGNMGGLPTRLMFQFRKFQIIQLAFMVRDFNRAYMREKPAGVSADEWAQEKAVASRSLRFAVAHYGVLSGALGIPFATSIAGLIASIGADDKDPLKPSLLAGTPFATSDDRTKTELLVRRALGGGELATLLTKGVPAALGWDLSGKLGAGTATQILPYAKEGKTAKETATNVGFNLLLGPTAGTIGKLADAYTAFSKGDYYKGMATGLPSGIGNAMKGLQQSSEGLKNSAGVTTMPADEIGLLRAALTALGGTPTQSAEHNLVQSRQFITEQHYHDLTNKLQQQYKEAMIDKDTDKAEKARAKWYETIASMREQRIVAPKPNGITGAYKKFQEDQKNVTNTISARKNFRNVAAEEI